MGSQVIDCRLQVGQCVGEAFEGLSYLSPIRVDGFAVGAQHCAGGVYDLQTFFGEGNAWRLVQYTMGGWPFDPRYRQIIERNSPFTYVQRMRTPLLIIHASRDLRAGVVGSEMLYRALKALERPVEYVRYPDAGHDLSRSGDPRHRMDRLNRIVEFFERHVVNTRPAPTHPAP